MKKAFEDFASNYGVSRRGVFDPLVSEETFYRVRGILDGRIAIAGPRPRNNPDFPLRNFRVLWPLRQSVDWQLVAWSGRPLCLLPLSQATMRPENSEGTTGRLFH